MVQGSERVHWKDTERKMGFILLERDVQASLWATLTVVDSSIRHIVTDVTDNVYHFSLAVEYIESKF